MQVLRQQMEDMQLTEDFVKTANREFQIMMRSNAVQFEAISENSEETWDFVQDQVRKKKNPVKAQIRRMMEQGMTKEMAGFAF